MTDQPQSAATTPQTFGGDDTLLGSEGDGFFCLELGRFFFEGMEEILLREQIFTIIIGDIFLSHSRLALL